MKNDENAAMGRPSSAPNLDHNVLAEKQQKEQPYRRGPGASVYGPDEARSRAFRGSVESGGGTLQLDASVSFGGLVAGFGAQNQLDLQDIAFTPIQASSGQRIMHDAAFDGRAAGLIERAGRRESDYVCHDGGGDHDGPLIMRLQR
jgi:hypothetical protein